MLLRSFFDSTPYSTDYTFEKNDLLTSQIAYYVKKMVKFVILEKVDCSKLAAGLTLGGLSEEIGNNIAYRVFHDGYSLDYNMRIFNGDALLRYQETNKPTEIHITVESLENLWILIMKNMDFYGKICIQKLIKIFRKLESSSNPVFLFDHHIPQNYLQKIVSYIEYSLKIAGIADINQRQNNQNYEKTQRSDGKDKGTDFAFFLETIFGLILFYHYFYDDNNNFPPEIKDSKMCTSLENFFYFITNKKNIKMAYPKLKMLDPQLEINLYLRNIYDQVEYIQNFDGITDDQFNFIKFFANAYEINKFQLDLKIERNTSNKSIALYICNSSISPKVFGGDNMLLINPNLKLISKMNLELTNFYIPPKKEKLLKQLQNHRQKTMYFVHNPFFVKFAAVLFNKNNYPFDFEHIWTNAMERNNLIHRGTIISPNEPSHYLVLRYYPIFYHAIQNYCTMKPQSTYYSIKGSPGTGKSTMLLYIVLRWFQKRDLINHFGEVIDTILISMNQAKITFYFKLDDKVLKFGILNNIEYNHLFEPGLTPKYEFVMSEDCSQFLAENEKISPLNNKIDNTLFIFDEFQPNILDSIYTVILNSIGSSHQKRKEGEIEVFTPLPTHNEMIMIGNLLQNEFARDLYFQKLKVLGSNIRHCLLPSKYSTMEQAIQTALSNLKLIDYRLSIGNPDQYLKKNDASKINLNTYIFQTTSYMPKDSEMKYYTHYCSNKEFNEKFCNNYTIFPSNQLKIQILSRIEEYKLLQRESEFSSIPNDPKNQHLKSFVFENDFNLLMQGKIPVTFEVRKIYYTYYNGKKHKNVIPGNMTIQMKLKQTDPEYKVHVITKIEQLNSSIFAKSDIVYYQPCSSTHGCFDSALIEKNDEKVTVTMFQATVSNEHSFNFEKFMEFTSRIFEIEEILNQNSNWTIQFFVLLDNVDQLFSFTKMNGYKGLSNAICSLLEKIRLAYPLNYQENLVDFSNSLDIRMNQIFCEITQRINFFVAQVKIT
ncbi:hypothetical protein TRFO_09005 [Tritrichomonas foetus]|uniref:Uncharacterized protein n=1 Tax=Tritrichomonas foetus TaxID=1144522 RepID=A0A1J4JG32_9EUKA|nr:hypothetical protein TRFO_09005 [Tritrichomonas foetus]|eukprot:OHS98158.1 hypothetical protein TRFO_09005 [Tritrichomonas foetus]